MEVCQGWTCCDVRTVPMPSTSALLNSHHDYIARQNSASVCFVMCVHSFAPRCTVLTWITHNHSTSTYPPPPPLPPPPPTHTHTHTYAHSPPPPSTTTPTITPNNTFPLSFFSVQLIDSDFTTAFDDSLFPVRPSNTDLVSDRFL